MSQWEHTVSELKSLGIPSSYCSIFLPFPLWKFLIHWLQLTSPTGSWLLKSIEIALTFKTQHLLLVRVSENICTSPASFQHLRLLKCSFFVELFFPGFYDVHCPLLVCVLPPRHSSSGHFPGPLHPVSVGTAHGQLLPRLLTVSSCFSGTRSPPWPHGWISILMFSKAVLK